jgi:catechol 2,3-dioxygenase-like lactoylglutathione lyase family enzyme
VGPMLNALSHSRLYVLDHDEALDFYVGKLGLEVNADVPLEFMRWLTLNVPGRPEQEILLEVPGPPAMDEETAGQVRDLLGKGVVGMAIFTTEDCRATYEDLRAKGVEFTQEPVERFYGTDCAIRDPWGNQIRITEPAEMPAEPPSGTTSA